MNKTWKDIYAECRKYRESDGICWRNCSCSGPTYSNIKSDLESEDRPEGYYPVRGRCGLMGWVKD